VGSALSDQSLAVLSFVGFLFISLCTLTGAFIWLRWGFTGVSALWRFRRVIDATVKEDFDSVIQTRDAGR
jgi:hypothetical protein